MLSNPAEGARFLITGGAGFIGSAVIRFLIQNTGHHVLNVDKLTYAGNLESLGDSSNSKRYQFAHMDICDTRAIESLFREYRPDFIMHLAAESHVDRSINSPDNFIETNIKGTYSMLEVARRYWSSLEGKGKAEFRFHHISTDEVYGSLADTGLFTEETAYDPSSPYSASKAASDHLVRAWHRTYGLPVILTNCSNNYGPCQFPEKLIPLVIHNAREGKPIPVYGKGTQVRDWLYVEDHARALYKVVTEGEVGQTYNIGGQNEKTNLEVVNSICTILDDLKPANLVGIDRYEELITYVQDRPGHDQRYAIDTGKIERELGWVPQETFESGLRKTIQWYIDNEAWVDHVTGGEYRHWIEKHYG